MEERCKDALGWSNMNACVQQVELLSQGEARRHSVVCVTVSDGAERTAVVPPKWSRTIARG